MAKVKLEFRKTIEFISEAEITVTKKELKEAGYGPWTNHSTGSHATAGTTRHPDDWKDDIEDYITNITQDEYSLRRFLGEKGVVTQWDTLLSFEGDVMTILDGPFKWEAEDPSPELYDVEITSAREGLFDGKAPELDDKEAALRQMMKHGK